MTTKRDLAGIERTTTAILDIGEGIEQALIALDTLTDLPYQGIYLKYYLEEAQRMITELGILYIPYAVQTVSEVGET